MATDDRWRSVPYALACLCVFFPAATLSWVLGRNADHAIQQLAYAWGLGWGNAIVALIVNRHTFSNNSLVFLAWALLGNGFRLLLFVSAGALIWMILPTGSDLFVGTAIAAYLLFLFTEISCLYIFSLRANRQSSDPIPTDPAQAE